MKRRNFLKGIAALALAPAAVLANTATSPAKKFDFKEEVHV